jgi:UDP-N-acetylglucosamine--N-acetylmuramyl-(pentapeptide) pyrophosphoryl-undecaprenol N-acetylglucosamine transferase
MRDHQHYNAAAFAAAGAAAEGVQQSLKPRALANWLLNKAMNPVSLAEMSAKMRSMAIPDAASRVADLVERLAGDGGVNG